MSTLLRTPKAIERRFLRSRKGTNQADNSRPVLLRVSREFGGSCLIMVPKTCPAPVQLQSVKAVAAPARPPLPLRREGMSPHWQLNSGMPSPARPLLRRNHNLCKG